MALLRDNAEPVYPTNNAATPDSLEMGRTIGYDDGRCPDVRAFGSDDGLEGPQ